MIRSPYLIALMYAMLAPVHALAQFSFSDETSLLNTAGVGSSPFTSGVAMCVCDMNGDGRDDIVRIQNATTVSIEYQTTPDAAFDHMVFGSTGLSVWAVAAADFDQNGLNDLYLGGSGAGLEIWEAVPGSPPGYRRSILPDRDIFSQGAVFADINNDGLPDIFACDDNDDPHKYAGNGDGTFSLDQNLIDTLIPGSDDSGDPFASGNYAAIWSDYDNDGDCDMYISKCRQGVSNNTDPRRINLLFRNNGNGTFTEAATAAGLNDGGQSWSADFADIDNDGDLDCFIINHDVSSRLLENNGSGVFTEITSAAGLSAHLDLFGIQAVLRDLDNDGFVDLIVTSSNSAAVHRIFRNNGNRTFTRTNNILVEDGEGPLGWIQSLATGDLNHDGFLDLYVGRADGFNGPTESSDLLFLNNGNANHFLAVQLTGTASNRSAIGAWVEIIGPWGTQVREVRGGEGYGIMSSFTQHFGLGSETVVPTLRVKWPSGLVDEFTNVAADQFLTITEGETLGPGDFSVPVITSALSSSAQVLSPFRYRIAAANLPTSYNIGAGAPASMAVNSASGVIEWIPSSEGPVMVDIVATNPAGFDTETLVINVGPNELIDAVESGTLPLRTGATPWVRDTTAGHGNDDSARSGTIGDSDATWLEATVSGPDHLTFCWRVSSEVDDELRLSLDGVFLESISGAVDWTNRILEIPDGTHTVRWEYAKDFAGSSGADRAWVDQLTLASNLPTPIITSPLTASAALEAVFTYSIEATMNPSTFAAAPLPPGIALDPATGTIAGVPTQRGSFTVNLTASNGAGDGTAQLRIDISDNLGDTVDAPELVWTTGGDAPWFSQSAISRRGGSAAQGGDIDDNEETWLETTVIGPGTFTFWWRVSSESKYDRLQFLLGGDELHTIDGEVNWQQRTIDVPEGVQTLRWSYSKDGSVSDESDTGWVDDITWVPENTDGDTLPDGWELLHLGTTMYDDQDDPDGDGQDNGGELTACTDPGDSSSVFSVSSTSVTAITWRSVIGKRYLLQRSTDLGVWQNHGEVVTALSILTTAPLPDLGPSTWWRVAVVD